MANVAYWSRKLSKDSEAGKNCSLGFIIHLAASAMQIFATVMTGLLKL